jgi:hypothetical protein
MMLLTPYLTWPKRNSEPQNVEGWFRSAQSFINGKIPSFDPPCMVVKKNKK